MIQAQIAEQTMPKIHVISNVPKNEMVTSGVYG